MSEQGNSAHIYRLDDGKFRLTFISSSPSGGQFLSEIGDFTRGELELVETLRQDLGQLAKAVSRDVPKGSEAVFRPAGRSADL